MLAPVAKAKAAEASELESVVKSEVETKENVESELEGTQAKASEANSATTELAPDSFDAKNVCYLRDVQDAARLVDVIAALNGLGDAVVAAVTAYEELVHKGAEEADSFRQEWADLNSEVGKLIQLLRRAVRFEKLRADVKVFDASKVAVQLVEELEDDFVVFGVTTLDVVCANTFVA
jgi:hypothetical protein